MVGSKRKIIILLTAALFGIVAVTGFILTRETGPQKINTVFVREGSTGVSLAADLSGKEILGMDKLFLLSLRINGFIYGPLKPGLYRVKGPLSYFSLGRIFCRGDVASITIPEGYTQKEIALLIKRKMGMEGSKFLENLERGVPDYEGKLFPATYRINTSQPEKIVKRMLKTYRKRTQKLNPGRKTLVLASIIQKEGAREEEFRRISGVFHNRLKSGMMLESDPTLQYVVGKIRLTRKVLENRSPYNTYRYKGLPPGPICNPGIKAIEAALNPERHDFFYFVSMRNGWHYFSITKWEHFRAVGYYQLGYNNGFTPEPGHSIGK